MRPIKAGVLQGSTLSPLLYSAYVNDTPQSSTGVQLALFIDDTALYLRPIMTYASSVFAHVQSDILYDLQVVQNKFCRRAADALSYVENSVLHRDLELPTISKFMKDETERFFDIASSHPNPFLVSAVSYEPPSPHHLYRMTNQKT
ncbi:hypothetical protein EVAR_19873_1 [Eumeta japonica]|uniref:Reverse transcriptase domain-containing protein n=1 Tax=Eumeta variegata TaxID=151549 RepID=A0A4C1XKV8_EUMVA|nr:hypothetical protein EVAR_19873_1 [Eumeta japonica]